VERERWIEKRGGRGEKVAGLALPRNEKDMPGVYLQQSASEDPAT